jgi:hypothetical protein
MHPDIHETISFVVLSTVSCEDNALAIKQSLRNILGGQGIDSGFQYTFESKLPLSLRNE